MMSGGVKWERPEVEGEGFGGWSTDENSGLAILRSGQRGPDCCLAKNALRSKVVGLPGGGSLERRSLAHPPFLGGEGCCRCRPTGLLFL